MAESKSGYGKRPMWQWILIYAVVAVIVYGVIYFVFLKKNYNGSSYQQSGSSSQSQPQQSGGKSY